MKRHLLAALILLPLTLSAAPASAAGEAADQARLINLFDMAELSGILHKEAMECGISRQDDPFYAPGGKLHTANDFNAFVQSILSTAQSGDHILVMSNGGFGGIHQKLLDSLAWE